MTNAETDENKIEPEQALPEETPGFHAPENIPSDEQLPDGGGREEEKIPEKEKTESEAAHGQVDGENKPRVRLPILRKTPKPIPQTRDEITVKIEKIMEEGLSDAYTRLSPVAQQEFKIKGEETANKIRELMRATHVKVKKILRLLLDWLRLLPGINRFFLEQEAKIKTDKILALKNDPKYFN